ncbi:hypothetical protein QVD17_40605 [Tagetes erecta]|uniref:Late embryogenesis abundant protein LEA-2 subgroup domain-containing protein n=1 Tax=Tagetes erecta TaxID=13708 RepID=A0AAD8JS29_TARER|nr:hypothetical protein QVD17_40605 [Tagetes erecta]
MTDRIHPSSKPKPTTTTSTKPTTTTTPNRRLPPPPNKSHLHTPTNRHPYRPNPTTTTHHRPRRRKYLCICCFWSILILLLLLLLITTIAGCIFYLLYHPHPPSFTITTLKITHFNLTTDDTTTTTQLTSKLNLTFTIKNPNKKQITFFYTPFTITCSSHDTLIAQQSLTSPSSTTIFESKPNNITVIRSLLQANHVPLETETGNMIRSDLKKKIGLRLKLVIDTEARVKVESLKTKKVGIRIKCEGIRSLVPKDGVGGKNSSVSLAVAANVAGAKCEVDLRIKIWKWTF